MRWDSLATVHSLLLSLLPEGIMPKDLNQAAAKVIHAATENAVL
jgi:hypothetical protein